MQLNIHWSAEVSQKFPRLSICIGTIKDVKIEKTNTRLQKLKKTVYEEAKSKFNIETLKDNPTVGAYRDFYWELGIDPTKTRPSGEALLRRILHGEKLPQISTAVDAYNLASMRTIVPISGFDMDQLALPFHVRFAENGETFTGIGMSKPITLMSKMLVLTDEKQVLCIYPYRDSNCTKIAESTRNALMVGYGAPAIAEQLLKEAALSYVKLVSGGEIGTIKVFNSTPE